MPLIDVPSGACYYRIDGRDDAPVVVLSHSLGLDHGMWVAQAADLAADFRVIRYDTRGHGASSASAGDYSIEALGRDVLALADALDIDRFAFCGLSLGGMIGLWLAANASQRLTALVLANTSARVSDPSAMETRRLAVLDGGMAAVAELAMGRFFSPRMLARNAPAVSSARRTLRATSPVGYAGCCAAIRDMDQRPLLARIGIPTLVIGGHQDVSMPWDEHGQPLVDAIADATAVRLAGAHLSNLECPRAFSAALADFLLPRAVDPIESGFAVRRAVLGDAHVDRSIAGATDFTRDFQELITRYAWGTIWTRPGLDHRTRRLLVLTTTAAMGRWEEFRLHARAGLAHDLEPVDLREVLLQAAIYAGVPAANTGFHIAEEEIARAAAE